MEANNTPIIFAKTSISAGLIIGQLLAKDPVIRTMATDVFPVVTTDEAVLPYISYRAVKMDNTAVKGIRGSEGLFVEVCCFSDSYAGSVMLAECARAALDGKQSSLDGITMRSCFFDDREEDYEGDAFVQKLIFRVKI